MQPTSKFMDSATAVNEPTEPVCMCAPQTATAKPPSTPLLHIKGCTTEATENTKIGTVCSYIVVQAVQEGHTRPQYDNK
jgi:hypothetical protein